MSANEMKIW